MPYYKKIEGERLYLSPLNKDDLEKYVKWLNDPYIYDRIGLRTTITPYTEAEWLENSIKDGSHNYGIILKRNDTLIGNAGIENIDAVNRSAEVGIFIGDEENRGKGCGAEALRLICRFGFDFLNLHSLNLNVYSFNENAIKCYEKVGFKEAGRMREAVYANGKYFDIIKMDLLREDLNELF